MGYILIIMAERSFANAHLFLDDSLPNLSNFQLTLADHPEEFLNQSFDSEELYPEPRNLSSSELSDLEDLQEQDDVRENSENIKSKRTKESKNSGSELGTSCESRKKESSPKKKNSFTPEQDKAILNLYKMFGGNWKKISSFMGGLSPNTVKNRYYKKLKDIHLKQVLSKKDTKKTIAENLEAKTECSAEKRNQLVNLYQKVIDIENFIKNTKIQIQQLVKKNLETTKD